MIAQEKSLFTPSCVGEPGSKVTFFQGSFFPLSLALLLGFSFLSPRVRALEEGSFVPRLSFLFSTRREKVTFDLGYHERLVFLQVDSQTSAKLTRYCVTV